MEKDLGWNFGGKLVWIFKVCRLWRGHRFHEPPPCHVGSGSLLTRLLKSRLAGGSGSFEGSGFPQCPVLPVTKGVVLAGNPIAHELLV